MSDDSGGGCCDREIAINSAQKAKMRRVGSRVGMDIIPGQGKCDKKGWFSLLRHQKVGKERESKGGRGEKGRGV